MTDLKPCPFCGGSVEIKANGRLEAVYVCLKCHAEVTWKNDLVPWRENHDEWNRRADECKYYAMTEKSTENIANLMEKRWGDL